MEKVLQKENFPAQKELEHLYRGLITEAALALGSTVALIGPDGRLLLHADYTGVYSSDTARTVCPFFQETSEAATQDRTARVVTCAAGYLFAAVPLWAGSVFHGILLCGPLSLSGALRCPRPEPFLCQPVRKVTSGRMNALCHLLSCAAAEAVYQEQADRHEAEKRYRLRVSLAEAARERERSSSKDLYPMMLEDSLKDALMRGDTELSRYILNRILTHIFFARSTASSPQLILVRLVELLTVLSRSAAAAGADSAFVLDMNANTLSSLLEQWDKSPSIEEIALWLGEVLEQYSGVIRERQGLIHADAIAAARNYILANYMHKLPLEEVARAVNLSPSYLSRTFSAEVGENFSTYLNRVRIEQAKYLLLFTDKSTAEITGLVGFEEASYFTRIFRNFVGMSPSKYREAAGIDLIPAVPEGVPPLTD